MTMTRVVDGSENVSYANQKLRIGDFETDCAGMKSISIITTDQGPLLDDMALWLALPEIDLVVPSEHAGYMDLIDSLAADFAVDYAKVIEASACAAQARFILWEKKE
ncbi:MAG: hypothetical protein LBL37_07445 [Gracilibacteraceae bacterium]|nr:hypothetical protein [Gracilibacteraceae bacterium]